MALTVKQMLHINTLASAFSDMMTDKYTNGVKEHGGNIWDMSGDDLLTEAIKENIDQFVYLYTLRQKRRGEL